MVHEKVVRHFEFKGNTLDIESRHNAELNMMEHSVTIINTENFQIRKENAFSKEAVERIIENHLGVTGDYLVKTGFTKSITIMKAEKEPIIDYSKIW